MSPALLSASARSASTSAARPRRVRPPLRLVTLAGMWLGLLACSDGGGGGGGSWEPDGADAVSVTVVEATDVTRGAVRDMLVTSGVVEAERSADLNPSASGMVTSVAVELGDTVSKGQLLATIDNAQLDAGAERASAEVKHLKSRVAEAMSLLERGAISQREVDDLAYQLATAETTLREARRGRGETKMTAPFAGVVAARDIRVGEQASGAARAFQVVDLSDLRVTVNLPERDVAKVAVGQRAELMGAYDDEAAATAVVTRVAPVIDADSGTFQVVMRLNTDDNALRPGQFVSAKIEVARRDGVLVVPRSVVRYEQGRPVAWKIVDMPPPEPSDEAEDSDTDADEDEGGGFFASLFGGGEEEAAEDTDGDEEDAEEEEADDGPKYIATRVAVELGLTDGDVAEIVKGLDAGERVITVGQANLREGARVREPKLADGADAADEGADEGAEAAAVAEDADAGSEG